MITRKLIERSVAKLALMLVMWGTLWGFALPSMVSSSITAVVIAAGGVIIVACVLTYVVVLHVVSEVLEAKKEKPHVP